MRPNSDEKIAPNIDTSNPLLLATRKKETAYYAICVMATLSKHSDLATPKYSDGLKFPQSTSAFLGIAFADEYIHITLA